MWNRTSSDTMILVAGSRSLWCSVVVVFFSPNHKAPSHWKSSQLLQMTIKWKKARLGMLAAWVRRLFLWTVTTTQPFIKVYSHVSTLLFFTLPFSVAYEQMFDCATCRITELWEKKKKKMSWSTPHLKNKINTPNHDRASTHCCISPGLFCANW